MRPCDSPIGGPCPVCNEPDAPEDDPREQLIEYYADQAAKAQAIVDDMLMMGRTVKYLDDEHVELEYRRVTLQLEAK